MYLFHYTNKQGFDGIKNNFRVTGTGLEFAANVIGTNGEPAQWMPKSDDVQKGTWYSEQHDKGFYLTSVSPSKLNNKGSAKIGINLTVDDNLYVFVFQVTRDGSRDVISGKAVHNVKNTNKYYIDTNQPDGKIPVIPPNARWCGKASACPATYD